MQNDTPEVLPQTNPLEVDDTPAIIDPFDSEAVKKTTDQLAAQKKHWREKAQKLQEENNELRKLKESKTPELPDSSKSADLDHEKLFEFAEATKSLEADELNELRTEAKNLGVDPIKYLKSKSGQAHLKEIRESVKAKKAVASPSNRIPVFNGKPVHDVFRDPKATEADKQAAFEAIRNKSRRNNQSI